MELDVNSDIRKFMKKSEKPNIEAFGAKDHLKEGQISNIVNKFEQNMSAAYKESMHRKSPWTKV